ncbi:MAG: N-acetylmuramic acid 6-phosphate etherase [Streptococcaceae bacterium]|jgi:N-acetylmuramic acid 6-phosphate etherase|nr:N-acetylmuramic acid 6-phosphate etherase [Streptococcaceae bacterium]
MKLSELTTEERNDKSKNIDSVSTLEMLQIMNTEDQKVPQAISKVLPQIAKAVDLAVPKFKAGGRLIDVGAGTSGRLGVLDSVELTPTYSVSPDRTFALIAGGKDAIFEAVEGAEDNREKGREDLEKVALTDNDIVTGLSASGRTPYVVAALEYAKQLGALTISVSCNQNSEMSKIAQVGIDVPVGPEVVTGSTRMKAGTAQKLVLNMISTGIMIKSGKVYQNLMINVQATNEKLVERGIRIVSQATQKSFAEARAIFDQAGKQVNVAILMIELQLSREQAQELLKRNDGNIAEIIRDTR